MSRICLRSVGWRCRTRPSEAGESFRTDHRGRFAKAPPKASFDLASRRGLSENLDGRMVYLWRAVDTEGEVLDVPVQSKRNKHAALKLMRKLLKKYAMVPGRLITDDLRSYGAAARDLGIESRHERGRCKNNRAENSHQPARRREIKMLRFKSGVSTQKFISTHAAVFTAFNVQRYLTSAQTHLCSNSPYAPRLGNGHLAGGRRSGIGILKTQNSRALCMPT